MSESKLAPEGLEVTDSMMSHLREEVLGGPVVGRALAAASQGLTEYVDKAGMPDIDHWITRAAIDGGINMSVISTLFDRAGGKQRISSRIGYAMLDDAGEGTNWTSRQLLEAANSERPFRGMGEGGYKAGFILGMAKAATSVAYEQTSRHSFSMTPLLKCEVNFAQDPISGVKIDYTADLLSMPGMKEGEPKRRQRWSLTWTDPATGEIRIRRMSTVRRWGDGFDSHNPITIGVQHESATPGGVAIDQREVQYLLDTHYDCVLIDYSADEHLKTLVGGLSVQQMFEDKAPLF